MNDQKILKLTILFSLGAILLALIIGVIFSPSEHFDLNAQLKSSFHAEARCFGAINGFVRVDIYFTNSTTTDDGCAQAHEEAALQRKEIQDETNRYCAYMQDKAMSFDDYQRCNPTP